MAKSNLKREKKGPRWRHREIHFASLHNQKKDYNKFTNKKPPELPENHNVWKSDKKELKKKHSFRLVVGVEMCRQSGEDTRHDGS